MRVGLIEQDRTALVAATGRRASNNDERRYRHASKIELVVAQPGRVISPSMARPPSLHFRYDMACYDAAGSKRQLATSARRLRGQYGAY